MAARFTSLLAGLALATTVQAQPLDARDLPLKMALSNLYPEAAYNTAGHACPQRFPEDAARWAESMAAWKTRHAALLADLRDLDAQLSAAVKAAPTSSLLTQEELVGLRTSAAVWVLGGLAEASDPQARKLCDALRGRLDGDEAPAQAAIEQARAAAREILGRLRAEPP